MRNNLTSNDQTTSALNITAIPSEQPDESLNICGWVQAQFIRPDLEHMHMMALDQYVGQDLVVVHALVSSSTSGKGIGTSLLDATPGLTEKIIQEGINYGLFSETTQFLYVVIDMSDPVDWTSSKMVARGFEPHKSPVVEVGNIFHVPLHVNSMPDSETRELLSLRRTLQVETMLSDYAKKIGIDKPTLADLNLPTVEPISGEDISGLPAVQLYSYMKSKYLM